jgi:DNA replication ATP-dependent helicase Dna2
VFDEHQALRTTRTVVTHRAAVLPNGPAALAPQSGTSASMPRWSDLHVYLEVDFDIGSAITVAFGLKAFWLEPRPMNSPLNAPRRHQVWPTNVLIVDQRDVAVERRELLAFLQQLHDILAWCQREDNQTLGQPALAGLAAIRRVDYRTKVQFYLWDTLQYEHLARVVGRHLQAILQNQNLRYLAWLFPSEELLPNPDMATRRSPITVVRDVVRSQLAAPIPHYYSLIEVARVYHDQRTTQYVAQQRVANPAYVPFNVSPLFGTPLSDQIPSERAHEIWARVVVAPRHWQQQMLTYQRTVGIRLDALSAVTRRLEDDLKPLLSYSAPVIEIGPAQRQPRLSVDGQLWHAFAKLNEALAGLEVHQVRAMPPHERAARFRSARLPRRLVGNQEQQALAQLGLQPRPRRRVYEVEPGSRDVKAKVGDFSFALAPEAAAGFLDRKVSGLVRGTALEAALQARFGQRFWHVLVEELTAVTVAGLDRSRGLVVIDPDQGYPAALDDLHNAGLANFDQDVILDPVHHDYFTDKLLASLQAVGNPPLARANAMVPVVQRATGQGGRGARPTAHTPPADFLWNPGAMAAAPVARHLPPARARLIAHGLDLNPTQWQAWEEALSHRAWLIWGPRARERAGRCAPWSAAPSWKPIRPGGPCACSCLPSRTRPSTTCCSAKPASVASPRTCTRCSGPPARSTASAPATRSHRRTSAPRWTWGSTSGTRRRRRGSCATTWRTRTGCWSSGPRPSRSTTCSPATAATPRPSGST